MLQFAVAPEIPRPTWSPTKSKPNEGVSMVPGNQIGPHHRAQIGIPLRRRMSLSSESQLMNLVRIANFKLCMPCPLTCLAVFVRLQAKSDHHYHHRRVCTRNPSTPTPVSRLQRSCLKRTVHHLGRMDMDLTLPVARGTQNHSPLLAQVDDVVELTILGSPQGQNQWTLTRRDPPIHQGCRRIVAYPMPPWTATTQRATCHEDQKR